MTVAFDVDGTLIYPEGVPGHEPDTPRYEVIQLFHLFERFGCTMIIWSGGGIDYAERWAGKLGLQAVIAEKGNVKADIVIDDEIVNLGKVNLEV